MEGLKVNLNQMNKTDCAGRSKSELYEPNSDVKQTGHQNLA